MAIMGEAKVLEFRFRLERLSQGHCMVVVGSLGTIFRRRAVDL